MIHLKNKSGLSVEASNDRHSIQADVTIKLGGTDTALNPLPPS